MDLFMRGNVIWFYDHSTASLCRTKPFDRSSCIAPEIDIHITREQISDLVQALEENGFLKPRLDERLRTEDLKITHRVLDLLGQAISK
jgi:hypothetical protein